MLTTLDKVSVTILLVCFSALIVAILFALYIYIPEGSGSTEGWCCKYYFASSKGVSIPNIFGRIDSRDHSVLTEIGVMNEIRIDACERLNTLEEVYVTLSEEVVGLQRQMLKLNKAQKENTYFLK